MLPEPAGRMPALQGAERHGGERTTALHNYFK
jgi:hypothetical protein